MTGVSDHIGWAETVTLERRGGPGQVLDRRRVELIAAGLSVARINFSHGTAEDHRRRVRAVRRAARDAETPIGILFDIRGPKLRLGTLGGMRIELQEGEVVRLVEGKGPLPAGQLPVDVPGVEDELEEGHRVFIADGAVELVVEAMHRVARGVEQGQKGGLLREDVDPSAVATLLLAAVIGGQTMSEIDVPYDLSATAAAVLKMLAR